MERSQPVAAVLVDADVERRGTASADGGSSERFYPRAVYEYAVDGETYRSANLRAGPGRDGMLESNARRVVDRYPEGSTVTAYYGPASPGQA